MSTLEKIIEKRKKEREAQMLDKGVGVVVEEVVEEEEEVEEELHVVLEDDEVEQKMEKVELENGLEIFRDVVNRVAPVPTGSIRGLNIIPKSVEGVESVEGGTLDEQDITGKEAVALFKDKFNKKEEKELEEVLKEKEELKKVEFDNVDEEDEAKYEKYAEEKAQQLKKDMKQELKKIDESVSIGGKKRGRKKKKKQEEEQEKGELLKEAYLIQEDEAGGGVADGSVESGKEVAVQNGDESGVANKPEVFNYNELVNKAAALFREQAMLGGESDTSNSLTHLEIVKAKANNFLDAISNVTAIQHELELIQAEKHGFRRKDELTILNSLRRTCAVAADICERDILTAKRAYDIMQKKIERGEEVDIEVFMAVKETIRAGMGDLKNLVGTTQQLISLERKSGNKPFGHRTSKAMNINYISGLIEQRDRELGGAGAGRYLDAGSKKPRVLDAGELASLLRDMEEGLE